MQRATWLTHGNARVSLAVVLGAVLAAGNGWVAGGVSPVYADHPQIRPDITKMKYHPIGAYKPGDVIPSPSDPPDDPNPSGEWVAYDTNVFETLNFPQRQPGDETNDDPRGSVAYGATDPNAPRDPRHGFCPGPEHQPFGRCANHQREWLDYYEQSMKQILGDFGVIIKRYPFISPGNGLPRGAYLSAPGGQAYNIAAIVPGSSHPDETVLVSGHYDFTDSGPAAAWDSAEGHTMVMRIAKIMADYWRATGTRPAATVKFIPWDSEESGTFGSIDYVDNNIPPGEEDKVRGYFNMDPCAGAYPAFRRGNPTDRVREVLQLANPEDYEDPAVKRRIVAFNERALTIVDEVFDHLDDRMTTVPGQPEIFVSDAEAAAAGNPSASQRDEVVTAVGGLAAFSSDYANFADVGIPIFNLFPDYFGPHADGEPGQADGISILHTPNDNLTSINRLTSADQTGLTASEGWMKGQEMCSHLEGWYMLQPEMAGAEPTSRRVVAYYEALPNEALINRPVTFTAAGSYRYANAAGRTYERNLSYRWDFGDGTSATGKRVQHTYSRVGVYQTRLVVTAADGNRDSMTLPVTVIPASPPPALAQLTAAETADGDYTLEWDYEGGTAGFQHFLVQESADFRVLVEDRAEGDIDARWERNTPSDPRLHPWQPSEGSPAVNGNRRRSGQSSYWTGAFPTAPSPTNTESVLTLRNPIRVPRTGNPEFTYWSLFQSEGDDEGRVELGIVEEPGEEPHHWRALDGVGGFFDPQEPEGVTDPHFNHRRISLSAFRGKLVVLRFRYMLGEADRVLTQPAGWYIDDIRIGSGTWQRIGRTNAETFRVQRPNGLRGYRIVAFYTDGVRTQPSNTEIARVTDAPGPDLRISSLTIDDSTPRRGQTVTFRATVVNSGQTRAGESVLHFRHDVYESIGRVLVSALAAGESYQAVFRWKIDLVPARHTIRVTADKRRQVVETNEANNQRRMEITVHR